MGSSHDLDAPVDLQRQTLLHLAVLLQNPVAVAELLSEGASPFKEDA